MIPLKSKTIALFSRHDATTAKRYAVQSAYRKGFTLIELLTVIAVVAILAAILLPLLRGVRDRAAQAQSASNLRQFGTAMSAYQVDNNWKIPPAADWSWAYQDQGMWGGKSWDFYLWEYLGVPGADSADIDSPAPGPSFEKLFFHPNDEAGEVEGSTACRRSYAMAITPPLGVFPHEQEAHGLTRNWGGPITRAAEPSRVIMLTERPGHTGNVVGNGAYADIVNPADQTVGQESLGSDGKLNYLFWDGHIERLTPLETTGSTQNLRNPGGYWTTDPTDDFASGS